MYFAATVRSHHLQGRKPDSQVLLWLLCLLPTIRQWCGAAYQLLHYYHIWLGCGISCNSQGMASESTILVLPPVLPPLRIQIFLPADALVCESLRHPSVLSRETFVVLLMYG